LADQVVPVALERLVLADADDQFQVAADAAGVARVPAGRVGEPDAGVHARGDGHRDRLAHLDAAGAAARRARVGDDHAAAVAPAAPQPRGDAEARVRDLEALPAAPAALGRLR